MNGEVKGDPIAILDPLSAVKEHRTIFSSLLPVGGIGIIPFPGLSIVVGKCLAPNGILGIGLIPSEDYDDGSSDLKIFGKEQTDAIVE